MSKVFLYKCNTNDLLQNPSILPSILIKSGYINEIKSKEFLALKIHFGEQGNKSHIPPKSLKPLIKEIKKKKARLFLFETNTLYRGKRTNSIDHINLAIQHGFGKLNIPIIIGDGIKGNDEIEIKINKKHFKTCYIAKAIKDIDAILFLSHFTGHMLTGFGAAIKNMGMGCASRKGKLKQHCTVSPIINKKFCISCGMCASICPSNAIVKKNNHYEIINEKCTGCAQCIAECPKAAIKINWDETYSDIQEKMAEYAYAVKISVKKTFFITYCTYITKECDCMNEEEKGIIPDIGVLASDDPVAIDKAAIDLIKQSIGRDVLKELYPQIDYNSQIQHSEKIGLGSSNYKLITLN